MDLTVHEDWASYASEERIGRAVALSARAGKSYIGCEYRPDDRLFFGSETKGLGAAALAAFGEDVYTIPIEEPGVRSLNLSNAVSIVVYEARRQLGL